MTDQKAYTKYPHHRKWFNKLWLSETLGYSCGPSGIAPDASGYYVVRPIMNLSGMSLEAKKFYIEKGDVSKVPPGYFWVEWFDGPQHSVSYQFKDNAWFPTLSYRADRDEEDLYKFKKWTCTSWAAALPKIFTNLQDVGVINVEFVDSNIIEVHLRNTPDPQYNELIPIWKSDVQVVDKYTKLGYNYIENYDNADGFLNNPRIGFMVK
jgi:hypothetical protein